MNTTAFNCSSCESLCCVVPPMLYDKTEVIKAQKLHVRVIAFKKEGGYSCSIIKATTGMCPFVDKEKGCSIYGDNFKACSDFKCAATGVMSGSLLSLDTMSFLKILTTPVVALTKPELFSFKFIQDQKIEIVGEIEAAQLVNASNYSDMEALHFDIVNKIKGLR